MASPKPEIIRRSTSDSARAQSPLRKVVPREQTISGRVLEVFPGPVTAFSLKVPAHSDFAKLTGLRAITVYQVSATELREVNLAKGKAVLIHGLLFVDGDTLKMVAKQITKP